MKKLFLISCILILVFLSSKAQQQVNMQEIKKGAVNFINQLHAEKSFSIQTIDTIYTYKDSLNRALLYEVVFNNKQAVLLSGSKACIPILGFYEVKNNQSILANRFQIPEGLQDLINDYSEEISFCMNNDTVTLFHIAEWQKLLQDSISNRSTTSIVVAPLLTSIWGQRYPYNYYAPGYYSYDHCQVGCVAVAMAQVMNYWKYPVWLFSRVKQIDWCNMADEIDTSSAFEKIDAVASLLYECGLAVNMDYCVYEDESSASTQDIRDALVNQYEYSSDAEFQLRLWHNDNTWIGRIKNNLNHSWPVIYKGRSSVLNGYGHAFVCDGYNSDNLFHFNFGWGGDCDGFFTLDNLTPNNFIFNYHQGAIFYIYPSSAQDYCDFELPLWVHYYEYYNISGNSTPLPYQNVPKTFTRLVSVPDTLNFPSSWRTIPVGAAAEYVAHEEIVLQNGFLAEEGSDFYAHIVPCPSCSGNSAQSMATGNTLPPMNDTYMPSQQDSSGTSLSESQVEQRLQVWPNPVSGTLHIQLPDAEKEVVGISVCDLLGRVMLQKENFSTKTDLDVSMLSRGMYIIQVRTLEGNNMTAKFAKE